MLETFTVATFTPLVGEVFEVEAGDEPAVELRLVEATVLGPGVGRDQFSLVFRGPPGPVMPQSIYPIDHGTLGSFELFLVPIGADTTGASYEAVFT